MEGDAEWGYGWSAEHSGPSQPRVNEDIDEVRPTIIYCRSQLALAGWCKHPAEGGSEPDHVVSPVEVTGKGVSVDGRPSVSTSHA